MKIKLKPKPTTEPLSKYNIIYCDPPWTWKAWSEKGEDRSASKHYKLLDNQSIVNLPVANIAAKDCVLFLWVTFPLLEWGLYCIKQWGFTYKTNAFTWVKTTKNGKWHMGNGYWTRANAEVCLLATRGKPKKISSSVRQLVISERGKHSAKPPEVRDRIVELLGDLPRVELFARERCKGWTGVGDQIDGRDIREILK